ncbi:MAG: hypothetical protein ACREIQ_02930, partial [Nitrospiria bacterium]
IGDDKTVAYLGMGGRNKTYATQRGGSLIADKCGSSEGGLLSAIDDFTKRVFQETGRNLKPHEAIEAMKTGQVRSRGKDYDVASIRGEVLEPYIHATRSLIGSVWGDTTQIDELRIGGGGGLLVGHRIAQGYPQAIVVADPQWAEARGQLALGRKRFG